jgi:predicted acyl esterase
LPHAVDVIGPIELQLDAACTAPDTAFIAILQAVDENENAINVTSGYLRPGCVPLTKVRASPVLPICRVGILKRCLWDRKLAIAFRSFPMPAASKRVTESVCT